MPLTGLGPDQYPEAVEIRKKIEAKKKELQYVLDNLEFDRKAPIKYIIIRHYRVVPGSGGF